MMAGDQFLRSVLLKRVRNHRPRRFRRESLSPEFGQQMKSQLDDVFSRTPWPQPADSDKLASRQQLDNPILKAVDHAPRTLMFEAFPNLVFGKRPPEIFRNFEITPKLLRQRQVVRRPPAKSQSLTFQKIFLCRFVFRAHLGHHQFPAVLQHGNDATEDTCRGAARCAPCPHDRCALRSSIEATSLTRRHRHQFPFSLFQFQSTRSACIGSICDARRAGKYPARQATAVRISTMHANVTGSVGCTPNNIPLSARARIHEPIIPPTTPIAASHNVCIKILFCNISDDAPSAMRIPISCVLWPTEYEITA